MLIGTTLLTAIEILIEREMFGEDSTEIRNLGLILCHFLRFAHDHKDLCRRNENGWQHHVSTKARRYQVALKGLYDIDKITVNLTSGGIILPEQLGVEFLENIRNTQSSYEDPWPTSGVITLESLNRGTDRTWRFIDWKFEVRCPSQSNFGDRSLSGLMSMTAASVVQGQSRCQSWHWSRDIWWKHWRQVLRPDRGTQQRKTYAAIQIRNHPTKFRGKYK